MQQHPNLDIRNAVLPADLDDIGQLWLDYLVWGNDQMQALYGVHPHNPAEAVAQDIQSIDKFQAPHGCLLVAVFAGKICGVGSLRRISSEIGEIKRMYVAPSSRGLGAGRAILDTLLLEAKKTGYQKVRLDSVRFMEAAHALYRRVGFREIEAYPEMEIPASFKDCMLFMELDLEHAH